MTDIIVALSACRLSRIQPQGKLFNTSRSPGLCFRPDAGHESLSHEHYGAVMRKVAWWDPQAFDANPNLGLAILVFFCYLESSMGNFREYRVHSDGAKKLMRSNPGWMIRHGAGLLAAWVEVETQNYWRRVHFSTPSFHWSHGTQPPLGPQAESVLNPTSHPRATVLTILCETHRLNTAAVASCWDRCWGKDPQDGATAASIPAGSEQSDIALLLNLTLGEYATLLQVQSKKLDDWIAFLPEFYQDKGPHAAAPGRRGLDIQPLYFKSQASAMNFAYYVTARVMQCIGPLESFELTSHVDVDDKYEEAEPWILTLLRIAAGLDWEECVRLNVYTIGFVSLLPDCIMRSRNPAVGLWMQDWLEERLKGDAFEEGNFPVFQVLDILRLVNRERADGRDVVSLFQAVDDEGGSGKLGSYSSQHLTSVCVYGRCRTTGRMSSYIMAL
ncbi:uncharacterized protein DNG_04222 [Cephalotrichum gorgonifer]|uniref:Uncharacterized protein n=1 Tax=Cephalotrichum gorgonifer TaxID=2041049 RepID=A0AAE8MWE6_9PEZI|nr:uncharacterized protein DNG_04222 [Cephalotrichum gorgonifer]